MAPEARRGDRDKERRQNKKEKSKTNKIVKEKVVKGNNHKSQSPIIIKDKTKRQKDTI